jgi:hypothetical protein
MLFILDLFGYRELPQVCLLIFWMGPYWEQIKNLSVKTTFIFLKSSPFNRGRAHPEDGKAGASSVLGREKTGRIAFAEIANKRFFKAKRRVRHEIRI